MKGLVGSTLVYFGGFLLLVFFLLPIAGLFSSAPVFRFWPLLFDPGVVGAVKLSLWTTFISTLIAVLLGTPLAYFLARRRSWGTRLIDAIIDLPMVLPPAVAGIALLMAFGRVGLFGSLLEGLGLGIAFSSVAVVLAQLFVASPLYIRAAKSGFESVSVELERVSQTLGVPPFLTFFRVTVPLAFPSLLGGLVATWARALGEFGATLLFAGNFVGQTRTMPLAIMSALESDVDAAVVLSILMVLLSFLLLSLVRFSLSRGWERVGV